jgi:predicted ATP-grasp superfamily ATP-dependent carboligase
MRLRMTSATTRRDSSFRQIQKRAPADVVARARGRSYPVTLPAFGPNPETLIEVVIQPVIKVSLRVRDPAAAKMRVAEFTAQLERIFASIRGQRGRTHVQAGGGALQGGV